MADENLYNEMAYYTLAHSSPSFLHQHVVDAHTAQHTDETTKPIAIVFALIGLYLFLEKDFSGRCNLPSAAKTGPDCRFCERAAVSQLRMP